MSRKSLADQREIRERELNDNYDKLQELMQTTFDKMSRGKKLFKVNTIKPLFEIYLENIQENARQHYNCRSCKHFFERFGNLVIIDDNFNVVSAIWDETVVPEFWKQSVAELRKEVERSLIVSAFMPTSRLFGEVESNEWEHLHLSFSGIVRHDDNDKYRIKESIGILERSFERFSLETVKTGYQLVATGGLYRADRVIAQADWYKNVYAGYTNFANAKAKNVYLWSVCADATVGFANINNSVLGSLLEDIQDGEPMEIVKAKFETKMDPTNYGRAQALPTLRAKLDAEKKINELNLASALIRRFATFDEVERIWDSKDVVMKEIVASQNTGIFGNVPTKDTEKVDGVNLPTITMTWSKFERTVLPFADAMAVKVDSSRLASLVTASDSEARNIFQWNNPFSWYYKDGIDASIKERVREAGGRVENNAIRCSLAWGNYTDLDLHCVIDDRQEISYSCKNAAGGTLDVDMNAGSGNTTKPVENIRFITARNGKYKFFVHNFCERGEDKRGFSNKYNSTDYSIELEVFGKTYRTKGSVLNRNAETCFEFKVFNGQVVDLKIKETVAGSADWNLEDETFVKVKGISKSPNLWGDKPVEHIGNHTFFLLEDCRDTANLGAGRGFFTETLIPELREIRKVLEQYTANTPIQGIENASASGVGYEKSRDWNLLVKVQTGSNVQLIKIDRFE
jgi:hypothetical protein